jgi:hypothetical protein
MMRSFHLPPGREGGSEGAVTDPIGPAGASHGRGEFFGEELFNGRVILARFVFSDMTPSSFRFEQAFSADWGKTWEVNWKDRERPAMVGAKLIPDVRASRYENRRDDQAGRVRVGNSPRDVMWTADVYVPAQ